MKNTPGTPVEGLSAEQVQRIHELVGPPIRFVNGETLDIRALCDDWLRLRSALAEATRDREQTPESEDKVVERAKNLDHPATCDCYECDSRTDAFIARAGSPLGETPKRRACHSCGGDAYMTNWEQEIDHAVRFQLERVGWKARRLWIPISVPALIRALLEIRRLRRENEQLKAVMLAYSRVT